MSVTDEVTAVLTAQNIVTRNLGATIRPRKGRPDYVLHVDSDDAKRAVTAILESDLALTVRRASGGFIHIWS